jgi:hypothetical protein
MRSCAEGLKVSPQRDKALAEANSQAAQLVAARIPAPHSAAAH